MECTTLLACELPLPLRHTGLLPSLQQVAELLQLREQSLREGWAAARAPASRSRPSPALGHGRAPCRALGGEALPHPLGRGKQGPVVMPLADQLGTDRQALGACEHGQREGRDVRGGP